MPHLWGTFSVPEARAEAMKHNMKRALRLTRNRNFVTRAVRAWRKLLPDWTPSLDELVTLESMPHEHRAAVGIISEGWEDTDERWNVLMALLEWERRQERTRQQVADTLGRMAHESEEDYRWAKAMGDTCPLDGCNCHLRAAEEPAPGAVVVPLTVVKGNETTVETPVMASFLDRLTPVKHLREKNDG